MAYTRDPYRIGTILHLYIPICFLAVGWWFYPIFGAALTSFFILTLLWQAGIGMDQEFVKLGKRLDKIEAKLESIEDRMRT